MSYPITYNETEKNRLDKQARFLSEPSLNQLISKSTNCLEIGCGVGSNLHLARELNPSIHFTGIDINSYAIETAKKTFASDLKSRFEVMDLKSLRFEENSFDLVFSRLTLWSVGMEWTQTLPEIKRVLKQGGTFYAYEPDDHHLMFYPNREAVMQLIKRWQTVTIANGLNPFIGREIPGHMTRAGFESVKAGLDAKVSNGSDIEGYKKCANNLKRIFTSRGPEYIGLSPDDHLWHEGLKQFDQVEPGNIIVEAYYFTSGIKS